MSFFYLATPYSRFAGGIDRAYEAACEQAALLIRAGVPVFAPIAHSHPIATYGELDPLDHEIWLPADKPMMDAARGLIVCKLPGWDSSYGISIEIEAFKSAGKPIFFMEPGEVPFEVIPKVRQIIGLCGFAGSGKDTAAQALLEDGWTRAAFADAVRESLLAVNPTTFEDSHRESPGRICSVKYLVECGGWGYAKKQPDVRSLLQRMGTEAGRNIHGEDCWIKIAKRKVDAAPGPVVISDVRFASEAEAIRSWGGTIIRIDRPGVGPCNGHASEALDFETDLVLMNDGTIEDLQSNLRLLASGAEVPA